MFTSDNKKKYNLTPQQVHEIQLKLLGRISKNSDNIVLPKSCLPIRLRTVDEKLVEGLFESCIFKSALSCCAGKYLIVKLEIS